jgi:hypothetical protein
MRMGSGTCRVRGMVWMHDSCWVSWEAEVIFRFAHEPVAVAVPR